MDAFPPPVNEWTRINGSQIENSEKFNISMIGNGYTSVMTLQINDIEEDDHGDYHCISRNYLGETIGVIKLGSKLSFNFVLTIDSLQPF